MSIDRRSLVAGLAALPTLAAQSAEPHVETGSWDDVLCVSVTLQGVLSRPRLERMQVELQEFLCAAAGREVPCVVLEEGAMLTLHRCREPEPSEKEAA